VEEIDPVFLGVRTVRVFCYLSAETVLAENGLIQQEIPAITLIGNQSEKFSIGEQDFYLRKLADKFLYNPAGIYKENGIKKATAERAVVLSALRNWNLAKINESCNFSRLPGLIGNFSKP